jgi:hypothetical protein
MEWNVTYKSNLFLQSINCFKKKIVEFVMHIVHSDINYSFPQDGIKARAQEMYFIYIGNKNTYCIF